MHRTKGLSKGEKVFCAIVICIVLACFAQRLWRYRCLVVYDTVCLQNLRSLRKALIAYSDDSAGYLPENLGQLYPNYISDLTVFHCPADRDHPTPQTKDEIRSGTSYLYAPGYKIDSGDTIVLFDKESAWHRPGVGVKYGQRNYIFLHYHDQMLFYDGSSPAKDWNEQKKNRNLEESSSEELIKRIEHDDYFVAVQAIVLLGQRKCKIAEVPLTKLLDSPRKWGFDEDEYIALTADEYTHNTTAIAFRYIRTD